MFQIRDNIHGYIPLDGMYAHIVNTPEFQRLRHIEQGDFRPVYPGARHDRFIHSLGTYHLATKFVEGFFRNLKQDFPDMKITEKERRQLTATFRYAALLHDIGHAPFSHTTEDFFADHPKHPQIWAELCKEVKAVTSSSNYKRFVQSTTEKVGASHEIVSAILLIRNRHSFRQEEGAADVNLELAARMVIGYTYSPNDVNAPRKEAQIQTFSLRNCLIQLLNSKILDVDRLDYLGRDTQMSGFTNAPLDLDCLADSVTAVRLENGWLAPAYRDFALQVFDLMFQAKLSHDAWVLANPAGRYDAALLAHCIRRLNDEISPDYRKTIFSTRALSQEGVDLPIGSYVKHYRLLSDEDVYADLKSQTAPEFQELFTRELNGRRIAVWRSYYEYRHLFGEYSQQVYHLFKPLLTYMSKNDLLAFDPNVYDQILNDKDAVDARTPARFLNDFLTDPDGDQSSLDPNYSVALLDRTNAFTLSIKPSQIRIVFARRSIPRREGDRNYSTYQELTGLADPNDHDGHQVKYFYLYRRRGLKHDQIKHLRNKLIEAIEGGASDGE